MSCWWVAKRRARLVVARIGAELMNIGEALLKWADP